MSAIFFISLLFSAEFYNVTPTGGRILTSKIMFDGIGKHLCLDLAIFLSVLLGTDNDGL